MFCLLRDLPPEAGVVVWRQRVAEDLHLGPAMEARHALHEVRGGVVAEV